MPQHLKRLIIAFAVFILLFLVLRHILTPDSFGELGHFRAKAIPENVMKELHYAGAVNCVNCHDEVHTEKTSGNHARLKCEVCHGPGLKHAILAEKFKNGELPDSLKLFKPIERKYCLLCHQRNAARIKIVFDTIDNSMIKQIVDTMHNYVDEDSKEIYKCIDCHNPHQP